MMSWTTKLPVVGDKKQVCVDQEVFGNYFSDRETAYAAVETVFEDPEIQIQCSRQIIDEAVQKLGRSVELRKSTRDMFAKLEAEGKLTITGAASLTPHQRNAIQQLNRALIRSFNTQQASLVANSLAKQVPLLTLEARIPAGLKNILEDKAFLTALERNGLSEVIEILSPQPGASVICYS